MIVWFNYISYQDLRISLWYGNYIITFLISLVFSELSGKKIHSEKFFIAEKFHSTSDMEIYKNVIKPQHLFN